MTDNVEIALYIYGAIMLISTVGVSLNMLPLTAYITVTGIGSTALTLIVKMVKDLNCDNCPYKKNAIVGNTP